MSRVPAPIGWRIFPDASTGCWNWQGAINSTGYGQVRVNGKTRKTHRVMHELLVGPIRKGLELDHRCRNHTCCNPAHLEPVTHRVNSQRGIRSWQLLAKTHCPQGHPYSGDNLRLSRHGRNCRTCEKARNQPRDKAARKAYDAARYQLNKEAVKARVRENYYRHKLSEFPY
jgi:hypothetical protein